MKWNLNRLAAGWWGFALKAYFIPQSFALISTKHKILKDYICQSNRQ